MLVRDRQELRVQPERGPVGQDLGAFVPDCFPAQGTEHGGFSLREDHAAEYVPQVVAVDALRREVQHEAEGVVVVTADAFHVNVGHHRRHQFVLELHERGDMAQRRFGLLEFHRFFGEAVFGDRLLRAAAGRGKFGAGRARDHRQDSCKHDAGQERDPGEVEHREIDREDEEGRRDDDGDRGNERLDRAEQVGRFHSL